MFVCVGARAIGVNNYSIFLKSIIRIQWVSQREWRDGDNRRQRQKIKKRLQPPNNKLIKWINSIKLNSILPFQSLLLLLFQWCFSECCPSQIRMLYKVKYHTKVDRHNTTREYQLNWNTHTHTNVRGFVRKDVSIRFPFHLFCVCFFFKLKSNWSGCVPAAAWLWPVIPLAIYSLNHIERNAVIRLITQKKVSEQKQQQQQNGYMSMGKTRWRL